MIDKMDVIALPEQMSIDEIVDHIMELKTQEEIVRFMREIDHLLLQNKVSISYRTRYEAVTMRSKPHPVLSP
jgi:uncharacterized protein YerC